MILGLDPSLAQQPEKLTAELTSNLALVATLRNKAKSHATDVKNTSYGIDLFLHPCYTDCHYFLATYVVEVNTNCTSGPRTNGDEIL